MDRVWIVTTKFEEGLDTFIEGVFDSYKLAHMAAEDIWRRYEPVEGDYLFKDGEINDGDICKIPIGCGCKNGDTWLFMTVKIEPYYVWH